MSVTGVVTNPASPNTSSATLRTTVSSSATVLPVDDAGVFAEDFSEARFLVIGAEQTPREYVAVQNDEDDPAGESVTLLDPVGGSGFEAGLTVTLWDPDATPEDKRGVEFTVWVRPDGAEQPVSVTVPHQWLPTSGDTSVLLGARVEIDEARPDEWEIVKVFGRSAVVDQSVVDTPAATAHLVASSPTVSGVFTTLIHWALDSSHPSVEIAHSTGAIADLFYVTQPGLYLVVATVRFQSDSNGLRAVQLTSRATTAAISPVVFAEAYYAAVPSGATQIQVTGMLKVETPLYICVLAKQNSGSNIDVIATDPVDTHFELTRVSAT